MKTEPLRPIAITPGVHLLRTGKNRFTSNVYFLESGSGWVLVDTGLPGSDELIISAVESLFGAGTRPSAIFLTHTHPDHTGAVVKLVHHWHVPVYLHPHEQVLLTAQPADHYASPLDRGLIHPLRRTLRLKALQPPDLTEALRPLDPAAGIPELPEWRVVPAPGHTPGHTTLFRPADGVLLCGDAVLTIDMNSLIGPVSGAQRVAGPPWITTWDRPLAEASIVALADLKPTILAPGHGYPMIGHRAAFRLDDFAARLR